MNLINAQPEVVPNLMPFCVAFSQLDALLFALTGFQESHSCFCWSRVVFLYFSGGTRTGGFPARFLADVTICP